MHNLIAICSVLPLAFDLEVSAQHAFIQHAEGRRKSNNSNQLLRGLTSFSSSLSLYCSGSLYSLLSRICFLRPLYRIHAFHLKFPRDSICEGRRSRLVYSITRFFVIGVWPPFALIRSFLRATGPCCRCRPRQDFLSGFFDLSAVPLCLLSFLGCSVGRL